MPSKHMQIRVHGRHAAINAYSANFGVPILAHFFKIQHQSGVASQIGFQLVVTPDFVGDTTLIVERTIRL